LEHPFLLAKGIRIPALKRRRKVWAFLPEDYFEEPEKRYPVIYFNDGQNVFEGWKAAFGTGWEAHTVMRELKPAWGIPECILIGIEHGKRNRVKEYTPFDRHGNFSQEGNAYADFVANGLKNFVDSKLRTRPEREYTALVGSSMGGLSAFYTAFKHQDVFSLAGVFSPSLWAAPALYSLVRMTGRHYPTKFYLSAGTREGKYTRQNLVHLNDVLLSCGFETRLSIIKGGEHNETLWQEEFRNFYRWLHS